MSGWDSRGTQRAMSLMSRVRAVYDYDAQEAGELSLRAGDIILVTKAKRTSQDWWEGIVSDRKGLFPANYVEPFRDDGGVNSMRHQRGMGGAARHESAAELAARAQEAVLQSVPILASHQQSVQTPAPVRPPLSMPVPVPATAVAMAT